MGDRANIKILSENPTAGEESALYFYTHSNGTDLWRTLQRALSRNERYDDEPYLNRIIFSEMIKDNIEGTTGYGISVGQPCDQNWDHLIVDHVFKTVGVPGGSTFSFEAYCALEEDPRARNPCWSYASRQSPPKSPR